MTKRKLSRFAEIETFENVIQPIFSFPPKDHDLKGKWNELFFKNTHPIVLELGCGRGEYTVYLAEKYPQKNFIGIDIKGARLWRGAKTAMEQKMNNVGFVRTRIEQIEYLFEQNEISEIWLTFPDPQLRESRERKRLTSPLFLNRYKKFLAPNGLIHLKTDNENLFRYTLEIVKQHNLKINRSMEDLYSLDNLDEVLKLKTTYEQIFLKQGAKIYYLNFSLVDSYYAVCGIN